MDLRAFNNSVTDTDWRVLAAKVEKSPDYLYLCALGHRNVSPQLAKALVSVEPKLTLHELRPDIWEAAA